MPPLRILLTLCAPAVLHLSAAAADTEFFEKRIRPILAQECYECHATATKQKGGLLLDHRAALLSGGDSGPAIVPGAPESSLLLQSITHQHPDLKMPKNAGKLEQQVLEDFRQWIASGAPDPRDAPPSKEQVEAESAWPAVLQRRAQWWSMQPLAQVQPPAPGHPVDAFLQQARQSAGLSTAAPADAATLLRRVHYILTGLPPSAEHLTNFNTGKTRLEQVISDLLASPRYGEKWARHWMDWVRYAESYGSEGDPAIPYAWRYRDYVISALNQDIGYPQMIREAVAGDLLPSPRISSSHINESALGIGQLRMVLHGFSPTDTLDEMVTFTDNQIDVVSKAFLGMTVSCARCHNHKFDAISQTDFYSWFGIFSSTHPAIIDASTQSAEQQHTQLRSLKQKIRQELASQWLKQKLPAAKPRAAGSPAWQEKAVQQRWDFRRSQSKGVRESSSSPAASPAGEFSISPQGGAALLGIYPAGRYSHTLSTQQRAVLQTNSFKNEGGFLWLRCAGSDGARARYIVQNYPRTGTVHKMVELKSEKDSSLSWHKLDLNYWKGDDLFIECTTAADSPVDAKLDARSWFGITEALITPEDVVAPPEPPMATDTRAAITAWKEGRATDAEAELLSHLLQKGLLVNATTLSPALSSLIQQYRQIESSLPAPVRAPGVMEGDARDAPLFVRGDHKQPASTVRRHFLDAVNPAPYQTQQSGRLQLAEDLAQSDMAARIMANRVWHHVFGAGIVRTADNFGRLGELPSHPALLDWLAAELRRQNGSFKQLLTLLLTSQAFALSQDLPTEVAVKDPENRLLSHWTLRRLDAEAIRDSLLHLSGQLDLRLGGPSVESHEPRRSVYTQVIRNSQAPLLSVFDQPVPTSTRGVRDITHVPAQSLALLNSPLVQTWSRQWSQQPQGSPEQRIQQMLQAAYQRAIRPEEVQQALQYLSRSQLTFAQQHTELQQLRQRVDELSSQLVALLPPQPAAQPASQLQLPAALADWDFQKDARDSAGQLHLTLQGSARISDGALVLDGERSMAISPALPQSLKAKTLQVWLQLTDLQQQGGGAITVQDTRGVKFDSIVFAEGESQRWIVGSDNHKRTLSLQGPKETEATQRITQLTYTWAADGTVTAYRNGQLYGKAIRPSERVEFAAGDSVIQLGCRHGKPSGNRLLHARIHRARVYATALTAEEVRRSQQLEPSSLSQDQLLATLSPSQQASAQQLVRQREEASSQISQLTRSLGEDSPEAKAWHSLATALVNTKEFIYLR